jgi:hypothetical protein
MVRIRRKRTAIFWEPFGRLLTWQSTGRRLRTNTAENSSRGKGRSGQKSGLFRGPCVPEDNATKPRESKRNQRKPGATQHERLPVFLLVIRVVDNTKVFRRKKKIFSGFIYNAIPSAFCIDFDNVVGVTFVPPTEDVDYETICTVEQLYQSFFNNRPTRDIQRINSISGTLVPNSGIDPEDCIGKPMFFIFETEAMLNLFGVEVKLNGIVGMCNAMVSDYESDGDKYTMTFGNVSDEQPFFTAVIYFKDETSMQNCRETCKSLTEDMQAALSPSSFIRKKNNF